MNESIGATGMHADDDTGKGTVAIGEGEIKAHVLAVDGNGFSESWHWESPLRPLRVSSRFYSGSRVRNELQKCLNFKLKKRSVLYPLFCKRDCAEKYGVVFEFGRGDSEVWTVNRHEESTGFSV